MCNAAAAAAAPLDNLPSLRMCSNFPCFPTLTNRSTSPIPEIMCRGPVLVEDGGYVEVVVVIVLMVTLSTASPDVILSAASIEPPQAIASIATGWLAPCRAWTPNGPPGFEVTHDVSVQVLRYCRTP